MKTILVSLISLFSLPVFANERIVNFPIPCVTIETLAETLEKFGEESAMTMTSTREVSDEIIESPTVLFVNYKTKTWTLAERVTKDRYCVIAMGENIKPYINQK